MRRRLSARPDLTLKALCFNEWFAFVRGWAPPPSDEARGTRWQTWQEFLEDYDAVREEFLEQRAQQRPGAPSFAEFLWQAPRTSRGREAATDRYQLARDVARARYQHGAVFTDTTGDEGTR